MGRGERIGITILLAGAIVGGGGYLAAQQGVKYMVGPRITALETQTADLQKKNKSLNERLGQEGHGEIFNGSITTRFSKESTFFKMDGKTPIDSTKVTIGGKRLSDAGTVEIEQPLFVEMREVRYLTLWLGGKRICISWSGDLVKATKYHLNPSYNNSQANSKCSWNTTIAPDTIFCDRKNPANTNEFSVVSLPPHESGSADGENMELARLIRRLNRPGEIKKLDKEYALLNTINYKPRLIQVV